MKSTLVLLVISSIPLLSFAQESVERVNQTEIESDNEVLEISDRVFGGEYVNRREFQYVARLAVKFGTLQQHICSGVVISTKVILTTANCLKKSNKLATSVCVTLPMGGLYIFNRNEVIVHKDYNNEYYTNNVAILKKNTHWNTYLRGRFDYPKLIAQADFDTATQGEVVGWGKRSANALFFPFSLQYGKVDIDKKCETANAAIKKEKIVCSTKNDVGICEGDVGGPLVSTKGAVIALSAVESGCGTSSTEPRIYYNLRTQEFIDWLKKEADISKFLT